MIEGASDLRENRRPLSAFDMNVTCIGLRETTVAEFRSAGGVVATGWSGDYEGDFPTNLADYCTYTDAPDAEHDLLPVNCVTPVAAASSGGRGPSRG